MQSFNGLICIETQKKRLSKLAAVLSFPQLRPLSVRLFFFSHHFPSSVSGKLSFRDSTVRFRRSLQLHPSSFAAPSLGSTGSSLKGFCTTSFSLSSLARTNTSYSSLSSDFLFDKKPKNRFVHKSMPSSPSIASSRAPKETNTVVAFHSPGSPWVALELCLLLPHSPYEKVPLKKSIAREPHTSALATIERIRLLLCPPAPSTSEQGRGSLLKPRMQSKEERLKRCPSITVYGIPPPVATATSFDTSSSTPSEELKSPTTKGSSSPLPDSTNHGGAPEIPRAILDTTDGKKDDKEVEKDVLSSTPEDWIPLVPQEYSNEVFWKWARRIRIGDTDVQVYYNCPLVLSSAPLPTPYVGSPLIFVDFKVMFASHSDVQYQWMCDDENGGRKLLATSAIYTPTPDMEFKVLILRLSAGGENGMWTELKSERVKPAEGAMTRWLQTPAVLSSPAFRVVTYNVLYDGFCTNSLGRKFLYPFCTKEMLDEKQRAIRIRRELMAYHADIICLQECGKRIFSQFFLPSLQLVGFEGFHVNKNGGMQEGCAVFFRASRFEVLQQSTLPLNGNTLKEFHPQWTASIAKHKELEDALTHMTAIGFGIRLRDKETNKTFVLGNTHFFYHADGCHIRMLQAYMQMHHLYRLASREMSGATAQSSGRASSPLPGTVCTDCPAEAPGMTGEEVLSFSSTNNARTATKEAFACKTENTGTSPESHSSSLPSTSLPCCAPAPVDPILFCGDCNCTHSTGAYRLLTTGEVEEDHMSWEKGTLFWWGCDKKLGSPHEEEEEIAGDSLKFKESSEKNTRSPVPIRSTLNFPQPPPPPFGEEFFRACLSVPFRMKDAYDSCSEPLPWTNYTKDFKEVLDYIMFTHGTATVLQAVPIPPEEELSENYALPNAKYASDHLALIVDMKLH